MYKLMKRLQMPILLIAGGATTILWGLSDVISKDNVQERQVASSLSQEKYQDISSKLRLEAMLSGREISSEAWESTVLRYATLQEKAAAAGLKASDAELSEFILSQFKTREQYQAFCKNRLEARGATPALFESRYRDIIVFNKFFEAHGLADFVPSAELEAEWHERNDQVDYDRFFVPFSAVAVSGNASDEEMNAYYLGHTSEKEFQKPEEAITEVVFLDSGLIATTEPGEDDLRQFYNLRRASYQSSDFPDESEPYFAVKKRLRGDFLSDGQSTEAKLLLKDLFDLFQEQGNTDPKAFLEKAKTDKRFSLVSHHEIGPFSADASSLPPLGYTDMPSRIFGKKQEEGGVYESRLEGGRPGYYFFRVKDRLPARTLELAECANSVTEKIVEEKRRNTARDIAQAWQTRLASTTDWGTIVPSGNAELVLGVEKDAPLYSEEAGLAARMKPGEVSPATALGDGYSVVRLIARKKADLGKPDELEEMRGMLAAQKRRLIQLSNMIQ